MEHDRVAVEVTLDEPVIASFDVATAAVPESLTYLPGAMLWGVLVGQAYAHDASDPAILSSFYGGGLVIGDALPMVGGLPTLPAPRSLHRLKTGGPWEDWSDGRHEAGYSQIKVPHVGPGIGCDPWNDPVEVRLQTTRRTAINPRTGRAADGQFYALQAIASGQVFVSVIEGPKEQVAAALKGLDDRRTLGRSRNAEFGRVSIREVAVPSLPDLGTAEAKFLWCLSDLAAHDGNFLPTERPDKIEEAEIDWSRSFVRHRTYSPFNAEWATREPERLVIARGSVIVLKTGIPPGAYRIGFHTEQGLGHILASSIPPLQMLTGWQPNAHPTPSDTKPKPVTLLAELLERRADVRARRRAEGVQAASVWDTWKPRFEAAERLAGERCGPTPSQWGPLIGMDKDKLQQFLADSGRPTTERKALTWQARFQEGPEGTFVAALQAELRPGGGGVSAVWRLAKTIRTELDRSGWFDAR